MTTFISSDLFKEHYVEKKKEKTKNHGSKFWSIHDCLLFRDRQPDGQNIYIKDAH